MSYEIDKALTQVKYNVDAVMPLAAAIDSSLYAQMHMIDKPRFSDRFELLRFASSQISIDGLVLEFGVNAGATLNFLASLLPEKKLFGFDSFEGLPEAWAGAPAGHFAQERLPDMQANVELIVGWFDRTLPQFVDGIRGEKIALLHVDCDLYSSTQTVLTQLRKSIVAGTIIVFDEYFNYPHWRHHEFQAFKEFLQFTGKKYEYIGLAPSYEHVAVRILN